MNLVNTLKTAVEKRDWVLVSKALDILAGNEEIVVLTHQSSSPAKQVNFSSNKASVSSKSLVPPTANKFVDDLTLESGLIEKSQKASNKSYRQPFKEGDHFCEVKCSRCGCGMKVTKEEHKFRTIDSESAPFTCIKCIRNSSR
jgi:hypothetical protein